MIVHLVLFRPKPGLPASERAALADAIAHARHVIPGIRRFIVGRRLENGPEYAVGGIPDYPFFASVEFDTRADLEAYLAHSAHEALAAWFYRTAEAVLIYDMEIVDGADAITLVRGADRDSRDSASQR